MAPATLRFSVGDRVACNMGSDGWAKGVVVALHYREPTWARGKTAPYQVQLDECEGGALIFAPMDMPQVIRAEADAPLATPSLPAEGNAEVALAALEREIEAVRSLPFVLSVAGPQAMPTAEQDGELFTPSRSTGPWIVAVTLRGATQGEYSGPFSLRAKANRAWPQSPVEVRFCSLIHHSCVEENGLVDPIVLMDALEMVDPQKDGVQSLCATLKAVHLLLSDPARLEGSAAAMLGAELRMNRKRKQTIASYEPQRLHRALFDAERGWMQEWFDPRFWEASVAGTEAAWRNLVTEEAWGVYSLPVFTTNFCDMFVEEIYNVYASGVEVSRPNSMNNYGVIVNEIGMEQILDRLQQEFLQPLAHVLFPGIGSYFDHHHSFIVRYKMGEDLGLDLHTDDSDVTFNICLGRDFAGAGLQFCGNQGSAHHRHSSLLYFHKKGHCVVHLGHRRHGADDITAGERLNLIVWNRNSEYRRSKGYMRYNMQGSATGYEREAGPPDKVCLSFTHDRDYGVFKEYSAKTQDRRGRGWCPPRHAEYEGFQSEAKLPN